MSFVIYLFLFASFLINIGFIWYLRQLAQNYTDINSEIQDLRIETQEMLNHLETVYNMDRVYGDSIIEGLMTHMKDYNEYINTFTERFTLSLENEDDEKEEVN